MSKVAKNPVKKSLTLRQILNVLDEALIKQDSTARKLWDVLTALRGPDSCDYTRKKNHTIPIRRAAFPKLTKKVDAGSIEGPADFSYNVYVEPMNVHEHFDRHILWAGRTLELTEEL